MYGLIGIIDLNKINNWKEGMKSQSIWINTALEEQKDINSRKHLRLLQDLWTTCLVCSIAPLTDYIDNPIYQELIEEENNYEVKSD